MIEPNSECCHVGFLQHRTSALSTALRGDAFGVCFSKVTEGRCKATCVYHTTQRSAADHSVRSV
jgi:hypothetical protein